MTPETKNLIALLTHAEEVTIQLPAPVPALDDFFSPEEKDMRFLLCASVEISIRSSGLDKVNQMKTLAEMRAWIAAASYEELLRKWRFEPAGSLWFQGDVGEYFDKVMRAKKAEVGEEAAVRASKNVGWDQ